MSQKRPAAGGESRKRDSFLSCALQRTSRGYERRIDDVIPTEQRKRGYERQIDIVIPMDAENAWIWQVETNVNLKKAGIL